MEVLSSPSLSSRVLMQFFSGFQNLQQQPSGKLVIVCLKSIWMCLYGEMPFKSTHWALLYPKHRNYTSACIWKLYPAPTTLFATTSLSHESSESVSEWAKLSQTSWRLMENLRWHPEFALGPWEITGNTSSSAPVPVCCQALCSVFIGLPCIANLLLLRDLRKLTQNGVNVIRVAWCGPIKFRLAAAPKLFPSASYLPSKERGRKDKSIGAGTWFLSRAHKSKSSSFEEP